MAKSSMTVEPRNRRAWRLMSLISRESIEIEERAGLLIKEFDAHKYQTAGAKPVPDYLLRAFTMDLMVEHFPPNSPMVELLRRVLKVSKDYKPGAWRVPVNQPRGRDNRGGPKRNARAMANALDRIRLRDHGKVMSQIELGKKVGVDRKTVARWRKMPDWPKPASGS